MKKKYVLKERPPAVASAIPWHDVLNDEQRAVVQAPIGVHLVIAGAGSGKTRTLTYRVAWLLEQGAPLGSILMLTFTNRAARQMRDRVGELLGVDTRAMWAGTFHGMCRRMLRQHAHRIGFPDNFGLMDREDAGNLMKAVIADLPAADRRSTRFPKADTVLQMLSDTLNRGLLLDDVIRGRFPQFAEHTDRIDEALRRYAARKAEYGVMDFDDLLFLTHRLLVDHPDARAELAATFQHILVDEYQDTNAVQARIVDLLIGETRSLMVVGDDCQSIYSFRGADFTNILEFPERHQDCETFRLERNYRSSPEIVELANTSIANNRRQFKKTLVSQQPEGPRPALVACANEDIQSVFLCQRLLELRDEGTELNRIAVLYRAHWQSMALQIELGKRKIPFVVRSGMRFFEQRHIKDVVAFLRFIENPRDELSFARVMALGEGVGAGTAGKVFMYLNAHEDWAAALNSPQLDRVVGRRAEKSVRAIANVLLELHGSAYRANAAASVDLIRSKCYDDYARRVFENSPNRIRELETMAEYAAQKGSVTEFLDELALASAISGEDVNATADPDEHVILSTIHQAKGLEFEAVFILWLTEERFPSSRSLESDEELEEERRLFYVATTRAERQLYLLQPLIGQDRYSTRIALRQSRFITEVLLNDKRQPLVEVWELS